MAALKAGARRPLLTLGLLALALTLSRLCWAAAGPSEYQVKAVFLFNFTQFVDWPPQAFAAPDSPFVIGVLGSDPFGKKLDDAVHGETVNQRPLVIQRYRDVSDIHGCNILFIERTQASDLRRILATLKGTNTLTVSDMDDANPRGVMIQMVTRNDRIKLRIDVGAVKEGNLTISSKLLRPAEIVGGTGSNP